ncbi:ATP-dependent Lon protease [Butyrivibrio fibrisolvens DSM 3071]|uniref:ATP-dependent Lon protease n=2 Tax=Butyrivibrio fibrisolvens TaxID=831 RepID=A0A1M5WZ92_BUTFI|nr:protease Lon-related BREX system protein BrxL [Butyrivibrio fibrisolvens]SHH93005.1 ATP-dependent Lon protease [Butyrivibrio fibrisolvens DSM 3071]
MAENMLINKDEEINGEGVSINAKLRQNFDGKIVRKDLTKHIKEGANVPVYVLEYLLGQYCNSEDEEIIESGVESVKHILADNYVRPDESEKILSKLRQRGSMSIIDRITVSLNLKYDEYEAEFSNLGLGGVPIAEEYPEKYDRLLCGGIWCIINLEYNADVEESNPIGFVREEPKKKKKKEAPVITINRLKPIQMPSVDINELKQGRKAFTKEEWIDVMLRSIGMEPDRLTEREKWLLLLRLVPLVENNFNLCELGPRSTGKSHIYKEVSPNSILVSGGQTTVANLFYNMGRHTMGLVGMWDCVAFDEVAGINFKDKDGVQIMKDYMASGSFARGKEEKAASASMVFVGNINQSVDVLLKTSSLFDPFPSEMGTDTAFLDRMHCYVPGWEIPKFRPEHFTNDYGFITDYLAEFIRELRKEQYGDAIEKYFRLGKNLNQRDTIAVRKMVGGLIKIVYPDGEFTKEQLEEIIQISLEMRRRVKEQLKKLGGMEFYDVNFSYIDNETFEEHYVSVPEQGGGKLIPEGMMNPGQVYTVSHGKSGMIGVFRLESQMVPGNGKFDRTGLGTDRVCKEAADTAFNFLKANGNRISGALGVLNKDFVINYQDLQGIGMTHDLALSTLIALCSIALGRPVQNSMAVLGDFSIGGTIIKAENLASTLQVCLDSGAKKVLLPQTSAVDLGTVPAELMSSFSLVFYQSAEDAVFKALGVE